MNAKWIIGIVGGITAVLFLILSSWLAGPAGLVFGVAVVSALILRFAAYLGLFNLPTMTRNLANFVIVVGLLFIMIIWWANAINKQVGQQEKVAAQKDVVTRSFILKPGEEMSYKISPKYWFRIYSEEDVKATTWSGSMFDNTSWLGDEIRDANFKLKSYEKEKDAIVIITLRPK